MNRLADIQDAFQRFLLAGHPDIASHVLGTQRVPVETRLGIYGDGYQSRLIEALATSFPVLADLLGETDFQALGARYVSAHESTFSSVRYYGAELADLLASDAEYSPAPLLAEMARWEWAMAAVFDAADVEPLDVGAFSQVAPEDWAQLRFQWSPAVQLIELQWNVPQLWKAVTEQIDRPEPACNEGPSSWLIWRRELQIYFRPLAPEEAVVMAASRTGQSFGELCVLLCEHLGESEASLQAAKFLRGWVQSGLIYRL